MHRRADAAYALRPDPCLARITAAEDQFDSAEHRPRTPGVLDLVPVHLGFDAEVPFNPGYGVDYNAGHLLILLDNNLFFGFLRLGACRMHVTANRVTDSVCRRCGGNRSNNGPADLARGYIDAKAGRAGQPVVERGFRVPEARRGTGDAAMAGLDRPACAIVPPHSRTVIGCFRTLAAHFVETPPFAVSLVAPGLHVAARIVVGAPLALVMNNLPIGKERPVVRIERRHLAKCEVVDKHRGCIGGVVRAAGEVYDFDAGNRLMQPHSSGWVRI